MDVPCFVHVAYSLHMRGPRVHEHVRECTPTHMQACVHMCVCARVHVGGSPHIQARGGEGRRGAMWCVRVGSFTHLLHVISPHGAACDSPGPAQRMVLRERLHRLHAHRTRSCPRPRPRACQGAVQGVDLEWQSLVFWRVAQLRTLFVRWREGKLLVSMILCSGTNDC